MINPHLLLLLGLKPVPLSMILPEHPDGDVHGMRAIGYWYSIHDPRCPNPSMFVDASWDVVERDRVIAYLRAGHEMRSWKGYSSCRFCDIYNGTRCLSDGHFIWPEGFAHYLEAHAVRPPDEFVQHVLNPKPDDRERPSTIELMKGMLK